MLTNLLFSLGKCGSLTVKIETLQNMNPWTLDLQRNVSGFHPVYQALTLRGVLRTVLGYKQPKNIICSSCCVAGPCGHL